MKLSDHLSKDDKKKLNQITSPKKKRKKKQIRPPIKKKEEKLSFKDWEDIMGKHRDTFVRSKGAIRRK